MRYTKRIILFATMLIALGISSVYAANGVVTKDGVRVRKGPSTSYDVINTLNKDATVEIIEETDGWYKIKYTATSTFEGYMSKEFVQVNDAEEIPNTTPAETPVSEPTVEPEITETPAPVETQTPKAEETPQPEELQVNLLGEKTLNSEANVYILPVITSSIKDTIKKNTQVSVQEVAGNFAYVKYNDKFGWIRTNLLQEETSGNSNTTTTERIGYVNVTQAIVRKSATTASEMITALNFNSEVTIIGEENDFYKIRINGGEYYMAKRLVSDTPQQTTSRSSNTREQTTEQTVDITAEVTSNNIQTTPEASTPTTTDTVQSVAQTSSIGEQMAQMAKSYIGYKYVYGGASPSTGFDCSGLVYYICNQLGRSVYRTADAQANNGVYVEKADLQPGDLVFFSNYKTYTGIGHVGIYIGNNQFVHASTATTGVIVSSLSEANYVQRYVTARRIY